MRPITALVAIATLTVPALPFATPPALAQTATTRSSVPEPGDPEARRQMLNAEQASAAERQLEANAASEARHEAAVALNDMQTTRNDAAYADALAMNSEARQAYRQTRKEWERTNPYCWDGNAAKCPADPVPPASGE